MHVRSSWAADRLERDLETAGTHGIRVIANTITHIAVRDPPVENVHAGRFQGYSLNKRRVLPKAEKAVIRHAQSGFTAGLKAADSLKYSDALPPPPSGCCRFCTGWLGRRGWSHTELSRVVELPLRHGDLGGP